MVKLDLKMVDLIGKLLVQTYQRNNMKLITLPGNVIMMPMVTQDKNALLNQLCSCIKIGKRLIYSKR